MAGQLFWGNREPSIDELLTDEIAGLLRSADGLDLADVHREIIAAKRKTTLWNVSVEHWLAAAI